MSRKPSQTMKAQTHRVMSKVFTTQSRHELKNEMGLKGAQSTGRIHSIGTLNAYKNALVQVAEYAKSEFGVQKIKDIQPEHVESYLKEKAANGYHQTTLTNARNAANLALTHLHKAEVNIEKFEGLERSKDPRSYSQDQIDRVAERQNERNALATHIAHDAGLRAHELLTLHRVDEGHPSSHREWRDDRFEGREGQVYLVTGKGGLTREVLIRDGLAEKLEARRLPEPEVIRDRGIKYEPKYDISGGHKWSNSFSRSSQTEMGRSSGAHGLRHSYAQERMEELQQKGYRFNDARLVVSQELGDFRGSITNTYLR